MPCKRKRRVWITRSGDDGLPYATVRLDLSNLIRVEHSHVLHAVLLRSFVQIVETSELIAFDRDDDLRKPDDPPAPSIDPHALTFPHLR